MNIVILDGYTLNPGDLDWSAIERLGPTTIYDRTAESEVDRRISDAEIILTNKVKLTRENIMHASSLHYIGVTATGYNIVDIVAARERNIPVTNAPAYGTDSVAQHTFSLLLELTSHAGMHSDSVRKGRWSDQPDFCYWERPLIELHGKTFGIVGLGQIGKAVARIALAFGMNVLAVHKHPERDKMEGVRFTDIGTLCTTSDVISLHCPLTSENDRFVNKSLLSLMKPSSFLINVSRGGLINEQDLADALNAGTIAGAGLDVLSSEPPSRTNPLLNARNCLITPHQAWASQASRKRLLDIVTKNIQAFLRGEKRNVVNF